MKTHFYLCNWFGLYCSLYSFVSYINLEGLGYNAERANKYFI
jgi:hypothetical protein